MATVTLSAEADVSVRRDSALAAGLGDHLPVGYWSGALYRAAIRFPLPAGFAGWSSITSATLNIYVTDHAHVGIRNSNFYARRGTGWFTKGAGSQDCESGYSGGNNTQDSDISVTTANQASTNSGSTTNLKRTVGITQIIRDVQAAGHSKIVVVLDPVGSADYMEFWSREHGGSYDPTLTIVYETEAVPLAPTLTAPTDLATVDSQTPTFGWTHNATGGDPQLNAEVQLYDAAGVAIGAAWAVAGATATLVSPSTLTRGTTYKWAVRTQDVTGFGPFSALRTFTVRALPVVTIDATRRMEFAAGAPRLRVNWTSDQVQTHYRVQTASPVFDSGWLAGTAATYLLDAVALTDNVAVNVTVSTRSAPGIEGSASRSFTPRYGLTTHRKDLVTVPLAWVDVVVNSVVPIGAQLVLEYGSAATALASPTGGWFSSIGAVVKRQFLFWRAWFIPSASASPTLDKIVITTNNTVALIDKWWSNRAGSAVIAPPWSVATDEYVYGTRSVTVLANGTAIYSTKMKVRQGRTYILTGLMKAVGTPQANIQLLDFATGALYVGTPVLNQTQDWYDPGRNETIRYRSPIWVAPADTEVVVALAVASSDGSQAWFEAVKLEESSVATPWSPGAVGAAVVDAGGVQIDGSKGGVFRYKGTDGGLRSVVSGGASGLLFAGDTELTSPAAGSLAINGSPIGGVYVGNSPPPSPANGQLWWDDDDASTASSGAVGKGAAFPAGPAVNDIFFRTDLQMEFVWDGARWLSTALYEMGFLGNNLTVTDVAGSRNPCPQLRGGSDIWVEDFLVTGFNVSGGTALSGANKWDIVCQWLNTAGAPVVIASAAVASGAISVWRQGAVVPANSLMGTDKTMLYVMCTKTGTPGGLYYYASMTYRIVG